MTGADPGPACERICGEQLTAQKTSRFVVELLADFLADATPGLRLGLDRVRVEDFLHHRQVLPPA